MWRMEKDTSKPVFTALEHIKSTHNGSLVRLPETAILFYMHRGIEITTEYYKTHKITDTFPRFLYSCPVYQFDEYDVCFLDGGRGAPQAVDTIETLAALGVKNVVSVGMFGVFSQEMNMGDIVIPQKAYVEEGASLHYYNHIEYSNASELLHHKALGSIRHSRDGFIVTTDAVYRQTFEKEKLWRQKGCVGVDMETSALFSVGRYLGLNVVSILIASDKHPLDEQDKKWSWSMTSDVRKNFICRCVDFALHI